jgi:hypothetical protein
MSGTRLSPAAVGALAALLASPAIAQPPELPGATYASIAKLRDWSGWCEHATVPSVVLRVAPPPLKPEVAAQIRSANPDADPLRYCRPPVFTGSSGDSRKPSSSSSRPGV